MSTEGEQKNSESAEPQPTPDTNQLTTIVSQLEDLVKLALAAEKNEVQVNVTSFVDVHKKLMALYKMIEEFRVNYAKSLDAMGLKLEDLQPNPEEMQELTMRDRKVMEKLGSLRAICEDAKERMHQAIKKESPASVNKIKDELKGPERASQRRKGRFKGVGGKKGWLPS